MPATKRTRSGPASRASWSGTITIRAAASRRSRSASIIALRCARDRDQCSVNRVVPHSFPTLRIVVKRIPIFFWNQRDWMRVIGVQSGGRPLPTHSPKTVSDVRLGSVASPPHATDPFFYPERRNASVRHRLKRGEAAAQWRATSQDRYSPGLRYWMVLRGSANPAPAPSKAERDNPCAVPGIKGALAERTHHPRHVSQAWFRCDQSDYDAWFDGAGASTCTRS